MPLGRWKGVEELMKDVVSVATFSLRMYLTEQYTASATWA